MKKAKYITVFVVIIITIVSVLLYNKSKIQAKSKGSFKDVYYVSTDKVTYQDIDGEISLVGTINANNDVNIVSETQGKVTAVYAKVGDYKSAGSVLFQVDDELKRAAFLTAEVNYEKAKKDFERYEKLHAEQTASEAQLDGARIAYVNAEAQYIVAKRQYNDTKIKTPISGLVTSRMVEIGTMVQPGNVVANVVDLSKLKVKINVSEKDVVKLKTGNKVEVTTSVYPGIQYSGTIETISSKADDAHSYPVEVVVNNNKTNPLKAGMFASVNLNTTTNRNALSIPRESLVGSVKSPQVFTIMDGTARLKDIVLGEEFGTRIEVVNGLADGETIVVNGQNNLKDNVKVEVLE